MTERPVGSISSDGSIYYRKDVIGLSIVDAAKARSFSLDSFSSRFKRRIAYVGGAISLFALACTSDGEVKASVTNTPESGPTVVAEGTRVSNSSAVESCPPNATIAERPFIAARDRVELKSGPRPDAGVVRTLAVNDSFNSICYIDGPDGLGSQVRWYFAEELGWTYPPGNLYDRPAVVVQPPPVSRPSLPPPETRPQPNPAPNPVPTEAARPPLIPERVDLGSGSTIINKAGNVGIGIIREEDSNYVQAMFAKYSEGRVLNITIARDNPTQFRPDESKKYPTYSLYGEGNTSNMKLYYVFNSSFDELPIDQRTYLMPTIVSNKIWGFLAAYKYMERDKFEGFMLRDNPSGTGILPLPHEVSSDLNQINRTGKFAYIDIGK